jgi:FtsP/CotA-like multicopper oxidase with cupredoxin domain
LVNGRGFPDSIADNNASWLPSQPYGSLARIKEKDPVKHPNAGLARYINVGTEDFPFHPHGNNGKVIAKDGHPLEGPAGQDLSYEKFSLNIGPGQTWDVLFEWYDAENYDPATNPVPVEVPQVANQVFGMFYSGSPYLGETGPQPPGNQSLNQCGEYYIIAHNHALYQITSWGVNMTGPITYMRIDPADTSNCP